MNGTHTGYSQANVAPQNVGGASLWLPIALGVATVVVLFGLIGGGPGGPTAGGLFGLFSPQVGDSGPAKHGASVASGTVGEGVSEAAEGRARGSEAAPGRAPSIGSRRTTGVRKPSRRRWRAVRALRPSSARAFTDDEPEEAEDDDAADVWGDDDDADSEDRFDDDDSGEGDDDDSGEGDDDDSAFGDDDDSAFGDDDDSAGDDDDSAEAWDDFLDRTYCLDWASADVVSPPGLEQLVAMANTRLEEYPLLAMPTAVDFESGEILFLGAPGERGSCRQDTRWPTVDLPDHAGTGAYQEPTFDVGTSFFRLPITDPPLTIYELRLLGGFSDDAGAIVDSVLYGRLDVTAWADLTCRFDGWNCYGCGAGLRSTCVDLLVERGQWIDVGSSAGLVRVTGR